MVDTKTKQNYHVVIYKGSPFTVSVKGKAVTIKTDDALAYSKPPGRSLYYFFVEDNKHFTLNEKDASKVLSLSKPYSSEDGVAQSNAADMRRNLRPFVEAQVRTIIPTIEQRWQQDRKNWHWQKFKDGTTFWYNMPLRVSDRDEFKMVVRFIFTKDCMYLLYLFPAQVRNVRYKLGLPMFKDIEQVFNLLVSRINKRFNTNGAINPTVQVVMDGMLKRITLEQNVLPAFIRTDDFLQIQ